MMKKAIRRRALSLLMVLSMLLTMAPATPLVRAEQTLSTDVNVPFTSTAQFQTPKEPGSNETISVTSNSYRIPAMVTLKDGTMLAASDIRWNTTYDGGGLDTLVARSTDGGVSWEYTLANYLGDNGNVYNGTESTCFIDPCLTVASDGQTVYMLCDLYPYGVALNGTKDTAPSTAVGFTSEGYLKLSNNNHSSYGYYLKDGKIYSTAGTQVSGYTVDGHFNLYDGNGNFVSNLFFADSPYKVVRTGFLYLTKSTDGGKNWSEPTLLNLKTSSEQVCLVGPGRGITTKSGTMIFPVYSFHGDNAAGSNTQRLSFVYSTDGKNWSRSAEFNYDWASEAAVVELSDGTLRFFFRNGTTNLCYVDYNLSTRIWGSAVTLSNVDTNSNTQISAITYSKTVDGKQVILVSCPTGRNRVGSNSSSGSERLNGSIFAFTVDGGTMTLKKTIEVNSGNVQFMYSCLTERSDGSIAILFEDKENAWGTGSNCYYTMDMKAYPASSLGLTFDETTDPGEGGGTVTCSTVEMFVGDAYTLTISGSNHENAASIADANIASMTVVGKDEVTGGTTTTVTYNAINDLACSELMPDSTTTPTATGYYYLVDGAYYEVYATRERSGWFDTIYTWGYYLNGTFIQIGTETSGWNNSNPTVNGLYEMTEKTETTAPQQASTTVTFSGLMPGQTTATIGGTEYTVIVKPKSGEVTSYLQTESVTTLDALTELGLPSDAGYTVSFASDSDLLTIDGGNITTGTVTGTATVIATVQKDGITVGTVTYALHISAVLIEETLDVFVAIGNKASIAEINGEVNSSMLDTTVATIDQTDGTILSSGTVTINALNNAENIGKHTSFVIGTTQYMIHLVPANEDEKVNDAAKYFRVEISQIENCTVYFAINGSQLHKVTSAGLMLDETFYDGFNLMFFAVPNEGYVLTEMTSVEEQSNGTEKTLTDYYSIANGTRPDGADSDAWPFKDDPEPTSIPSSASDSVWVSGHGFRWCLMEGNMTIEGMRAMFTDALSKGAQGVTTVTKNGGDGIKVRFSFVAEQLPTFEKTIVAVNGEPFAENTVIEFGDVITYQFAITTTSNNVDYTSIRIVDEYIGYDTQNSIADGAIDAAGTYTFTADYTVNVGDVDKYVNGQFVNKAELSYSYTSPYDSGEYHFTDQAYVTCDISGMVYYTWADNVPAEITGNATVYPLPEQAVVTYNTPFQVQPYTGATEYVVTENGVDVGKWVFKCWNLAGAEYSGGETVTMSSEGSLAFEGIWEYTPYPTYTVTYQWTGAPATGVTLPADTNTYYQGQTYSVDTTYKAGDTYDAGALTYTFTGWKLEGTLVTGTQTIGTSDVILVGAWTTTQNITGLTIDKAFSGDAGYSMDENQTFLFRIEGLDDDVDLIVTIHGDSQINIEGLTVGNRYKITELTGWSWRYGNCTPSASADLSPAVDGNSITVTLGADRSMNIVTFTNTRTVEKWIDGDAWCENLFKK